MNFLLLIITVALSIISLLCAVFLFAKWMLSQIFDSIQPLELSPKCQSQLSTEGHSQLSHQVDHSNGTERNPLFRHFPHLKQKLGWEELGVYPTPIHTAQLDLDGGNQVSFYLKREDLSSPLYGGNKVRTLQYQIPACKAHTMQNPDSNIYVMGSSGSNNVVATITHGAAFNLNFHVSYFSFDAPDMDNTLNLLSTLSFGPLSLKIWDKILPQMKRLISVVTSKKDKVFGLGGNSVAGILGQIGGALELAEQIENGELPDVDEIYLPMGSSCTTTGLILGICLARHLKLKAFQSKRFKIVSVVIHDGVASLNRKTNCIRNGFGKYLQLSPEFGISRTAIYFKKLTGIDLEPAALKFMKEEWDVVDSAEYAGIYGAHSEKSATAASLDHKLVISGESPSWVKGSPPLPWLCGHFSGKAFAVMLDRMQERREKGINVLLWQTKSNVQPLGKCDEWTPFQKMAADSKIFKEWSDNGKATSVLRPGKVDAQNGNPLDYRPLMKQIL